MVDLLERVASPRAWCDCKVAIVGCISDDTLCFGTILRIRFLSSSITSKTGLTRLSVMPLIATTRCACMMVLISVSRMIVTDI